jgi:hypothetical protein
MNKKEFSEWFRKYVFDNCGTVANFCATYHISPGLVYDILAGRREPTPQILSLTGWTRVKSVSYERRIE